MRGQNLRYSGNFFLFHLQVFFNPLTPVPPLTAHDKLWPFFHFWRKQGNKFSKFEKPEAVGHFLVKKLSQNSDFCARLSQIVLEYDSSGKNR